MRKSLKLAMICADAAAVSSFGQAGFYLNNFDVDKTSGYPFSNMDLK